jgi:hypothetical protein
MQAHPHTKMQTFGMIISKDQGWLIVFLVLSLVQVQISGYLARQLKMSIGLRWHILHRIAALIC